MRHWVVLMLFLVALGALRAVGCGDYEDEGCELDKCEGVVCPPDDNECTRESCDRASGDCVSRPVEDGTNCTYGGLSGVCVEGVCGENLCKDVVCDDGLACTDDTCDFRNGTCDFRNVCNDFDDCTENICNPLDGLCDFTTPVEDGTTCDMSEPLPLYGLGTCEDGVCVGRCDPEAKEELPCPVHGYEWMSCCPGLEFALSTSPEEPCPVNLCEGVVCDDDGNPCTRNYCDIGDGRCHIDYLHGEPCELDGLSGICSWEVCEVQGGTGGTGGAGGTGGTGGSGNVGGFG